MHCVFKSSNDTESYLMSLHGRNYFSYVVAIMPNCSSFPIQSLCKQRLAENTQLNSYEEHWTKYNIL